MFGAGYRTPAKDSRQMSTNPGTQMSPEREIRSSDSMASTDSRVRRSIGDWETGKTGPNSNRPSPPVNATGPLIQKKKVLSQGGGATARGGAKTVPAASLVMETAKPRERAVESTNSRLIEGDKAAGVGPAQVLEAKPWQSQTSQMSRPRDAQAASSKPMISKEQSVMTQREELSTDLSDQVACSQNKGRVAEAKACLIKAKLLLNNSRNLKAEIKTGVIQAIERLYQLVKEADATGSNDEKPSKKQKEKEKNQTTVPTKGKDEVDLIRKIEEHSELIKENNEAMKLLKGAIEKQHENMEKTTYASVAASSSQRRNQGQAALHSVVVSSKDEMETGDEILTQIREAVNAKEGWVKIDKVRKAKDRKVIVGCSSEEERQKVKERLKRVGDRLNVEEIQNKDPLLILRDVFQYNSDEDIKNALRKQNQGLFENIEEEVRVEIRFRRKTRNPHISHVIIRVSPKLWLRMVEAEAVHIDMQKIRVADYSPLVQCSLCLGYGHGRRFCKETIAKCSHCGGPHMKMECANWLANVPPTCCNCTRLKVDQTEHNAFSQECSIRRKWDALARSSIAYC